MNHMLYSLYMANEHKVSEAFGMGFGTIQAVTAAVTGTVTSAVSSHCTIM